MKKRLVLRRPGIRFTCDINKPEMTSPIPPILMIVSVSPSMKKAKMAVSTGMAFVKAFDFVTPIFFMEKVKKMNAKEEPKKESSSMGTTASATKPT